MSYIVRDPEAFSFDRVRKGGRIEEPKHLAFIRRLPSVISGQYGVEACHIRMGDPRHGKPTTAKGRKPDDGWVLPMTPMEHRSQHSMSERAFWIDHGMDDPCGFALRLYQITGDFEAAERLILDHVGSITR